MEDEIVDGQDNVVKLISDILDAAKDRGASIVEVIQACRCVSAACMERINAVADELSDK